MLKRVISVLLVISLCFCFVGCDSANTASEEEGEQYTYTQLVNKPDDWETNYKSYYVLDADGTPVPVTGDTAPEFVANKYLVKGLIEKAVNGDAEDITSDDAATTSNGSKATTSTNKGGTANNTGKVNAKATKTTKFAANPYSDVPAEVKGTTVEFLMNRTINDGDYKIIAEFEKITGIKIKFIYANYGTYGETVANMVAAKNAPDIINGERLAYPNGFITLCDPMDAETFKLDDPFWDIKSMQGSKLRGKYYGVISTKSIYHDARMLMYNVTLLKKLLGSDYATKSPRALWKAGKWDLDALYDLCATIKNAQPDLIPLTYISQYDFALASGQDLVKFDGTKFSSNVSNPTLRKGWEWFNKLRNSTGYSEPYNMNNFLAQKDVMFINTIYNCYNKNSIAGQASQKFEVDAVPVPGINGVTNAPCDYRTFSLAKGAKNPVGAAYFIRYWADNSNTNERAEAVSSDIWDTAVYVSNTMPKTFEFSSSLLYYVSTSAENQVRNDLVTAKASQMSTAFAKVENQISNACARVNKAVLKVK
ncbi:MAG: carbohydrate ABC transporter substrate-binding protein [Clostridia bacterium]|nr:carbohydrate ABC transporter substrate-binding protein [Clostridia bacterium]